MDVLPLSDVFGLFLPGLAAGSGLGAIAWMVGYIISGVYRWIKKS